MNYNNMSLYAKLKDGRYEKEFPEQFFAPVSFIDGYPSISTNRWKKINKLETFYEWTIFYTKEFQIIEDYLNGYSKFCPNWYMLRFRSRQNNLLDIEYDSIYDLSSINYTPINIDTSTGQEVSGNGINLNASESSRYALNSFVTYTKKTDDNIKQYMVPISLTVQQNAMFGKILMDVRTGVIKLPGLNQNIN